MELGTIFTLEQYDEAYKFATENGYMIKEIESKEEKRIVEVLDFDENGNPITREVEETVVVRYFQIVEIPLPPAPTYEEVKQIRESLYKEYKDPITCQIQSLRDEEQTEEVIAEIEDLKIKRAEIVAEIKENNPYPEE